MNNVLLLLGALLVGILTALVAVPMVVDWNGYRGVFEEEASRLLGRDVRVGGAVAVRILPVPYVRFEKLRIADTASTGGDPLFRADSVTMRLSIAPLLRGVLEAQSVELKKPSLRLAVDGEGRGNWRSLSLKPGSLPFVPADVTLQSVGIEGGTLSFFNASGRELAQFEAVDGELSADGFEGPFKFKGTASWYGEARELRFATGKPEADGSAHIKASVRLPLSLNSYAFDGRIKDLKGKPQLDGELTAKLPVAPSKTVKPAEADAQAFELKAKVEGDLNGGKLSDIALALEQAGDPQIITGDVQAAWGDTLRFDMALTARSLNLDRFGASASGDPLETARTALNVILAALPAEAQTDAKFKAERVTLAGEPVTGVTIAMSRRGSTLEIKDIRAVLPGKTRLEASGTIGRDAKSFAFTGPVGMRGANLARFLTWARKDPGAPVAATGAASGYDGPFSLDGQLAIAGDNIALTKAAGELGGEPVSGEFRVTTDGRRRIALVLQGQRVDAALVWPGGFDLNRLRTVLAGTNDAAAGTARTLGLSSGLGFFGFDPDTTDLKAEIRAGELQANRAVALRDVDAAFTVERGTLVIPRLRFQTAAGLTVDLDGQIAGLGPSVSRVKAAGGDEARGTHGGVVRFIVGTTGAVAVEEAMSFIDWPVEIRPSQALIAALGVTRLAGSVSAGAQLPGLTELQIDGTVDGGHVVGTARLEAGFAGWRAGGLDLTAAIDARSLTPWLRLAGLVEPNDGRPAFDRPGQIQVKVSGQPLAGLSAFASVNADDVQVTYQGAATFAKDQPVALNGAASFNARDGADVLALAGLSFGQSATGVALQGQVQIQRHNNELTLAARDVSAGGTLLSGTAVLSTAPSGLPERTLTAGLSVDTASLPGLLSLLTDHRQGSGAPSKETPHSVWPVQPFAFAGLDHLNGRIELAAGRLEIDGAGLLTNAKAQITLAPGSVSVDDLTGRSALGGLVAAQFALHKSTGGTTLTGKGRIEGDTLAVSQTGAMPLTVTASFAAHGVSPGGLIAGLQGEGEAVVGPGQLKGVGPSGVTAIVEAVLAGKMEPSGEELALAVREGLASSALVLNQRKIPFTLAAGQVRIPLTVFETPDGRASVETMLDLNGLRFSTDWRIEAAAKPGVTGKPKQPLPAVVVSTSGLIATMAEADTKLTLTAFEQELGLRKLERDGEELERMRKLDEQRRQNEDAERARLAAEAEAARAAAANAASAPQQAGAAAPGDARAAAQPAPSAPTPAASAAGLPSQGAPQAAAQGPVNAPARHSAPVNRRRAQEGIPQPFQNNF